MTPFVPVMLFGWVPFTILLFFSRIMVHRAVLLSVIGGVLFLPMISYDWPGLPRYSKETAISLGLILGSLLSGKREAGFKLSRYDFAMIIWCVCPIASSLDNDLGVHDGLSTFFSQCMVWGIPYFAGRVYFNNLSLLKDLGIGFIVGGLLYGFLCLYEIRMSPQLSNIFYGFFPHSFAQHVRYGGYRPIVFMQHGLMVSLWMAVSTVVAFWMWRDGMKYLKGISMPFVASFLMIITIFCKSSGAICLMVVGCFTYVACCIFNIRKMMLVLLFIIPLYCILRTFGFVTVDDVLVIAQLFFNAERLESLEIRLFQEGLFAAKALEQPWFGWGIIGRGWPTDLDGIVLVNMVDPLWLIILSGKGFVGLTSFLVAMLLGPYLHFRSYLKNNNYNQVSLLTLVLSLIVVLFMIDSLQNGMINIIYVMTSGALVSCYLAGRGNPGQHIRGGGDS